MGLICVKCSKEAEVLVEGKPFCRDCAFEELKKKLQKQLMPADDGYLTQDAIAEWLENSAFCLEKLVCSCGKPAEYAVSGHLFCQDCLLKCLQILPAMGTNLLNDLSLIHI